MRNRGSSAAIRSKPMSLTSSPPGSIKSTRAPAPQIRYFHATPAYVIGVFVGSGLIAGFAGCVLAAKLRIGQANVGLDYLLPALVGAFLGTTTIKPGRVNVWGTIFGVLILAVGISG